MFDIVLFCLNLNNPHVTLMLDLGTFLYFCETKGNVTGEVAMASVAMVTFVHSLSMMTGRDLGTDRLKLIYSAVELVPLKHHNYIIFTDIKITLILKKEKEAESN